MIYDITQPLFECAVFPGDEPPVRNIVMSIEKGDICNLTTLSMCAHNGTHVDAPYHFIRDGKAVDEVPLETWIGPAYVTEHEGNVTAADAETMLKKAAAVSAAAAKRILIKGNATMTEAGARVFAGAGIDLIGNESQTFGPAEAPAAVHRILLGAGIVLLEGIRLGHVPEGAYLLNCAPLNLTGADGAPCRATLTGPAAK
ncbi:MAG: cyclase [Clostridiales bacterium]|nr:cyclase [Clostridiales bacterium]